MKRILVDYFEVSLLCNKTAEITQGCKEGEIAFVVVINFNDRAWNCLDFACFILLYQALLPYTNDWALHNFIYCVKSEFHRHRKCHTFRFVIYRAGVPARHLLYHANSLFVEQLVTAAL